jgi:uncharacterized membrane protein
MHDRVISKTGRSSSPLSQTARRWPVWPLARLLALALLSLHAILDARSIVRVALAGVLALWAPGSLVVLLFHGRADLDLDLDIVERLALGATTSLAFGGIIGVLLAHSPWGLRLVPFLLAAILFSLGCWLFIPLYLPGPRRGIPRPWRQQLRFLVEFCVAPRFSGRLLTAGLLITLFGGLWAVRYAASNPQPGASLTEFFILNPPPSPQRDAATPQVGTPYPISLGIRNRRAESARFEVVALADGQAGRRPAVVGGAAALNLGPDEFRTVEIELVFDQPIAGGVVIELILYRAGSPDRSLRFRTRVEQKSGRRP